MERPYRPPVTIEEVIAYIEKSTETLFDPTLVPIFVRDIIPEMVGSYPVPT